MLAPGRPVFTALAYLRCRHVFVARGTPQATVLLDALCASTRPHHIWALGAALLAQIGMSLAYGWGNLRGGEVSLIAVYTSLHSAARKI